MENKSLQISSLGSKDKNNLDITSLYKGATIERADLVTRPDGSKGSSASLDTNTGVQTNNLTGNTYQTNWDNSPNNPVIQNFQKLFSVPNKELDHPEVQTQLFDADNLVKGESGIYREMNDGLTPWGTDADGKSLYSFNSISNDQSADLGKNKLYTTGSILQGLGAFDNEEEANRFAKYTQNSGDPSFMGAIAGLSASGQKKEATNLIMKEFGYPDLDNLDSHDDKKRAYGTAFAAYNYVENVEKMSPAQQSLSLSTLGLMSYKFDDGTTLKDRAVVKGADGKTELSVSEAFSLAGSGFDVPSMQKNWDQLSAIQQITYGKGTPSQLAATGKRLQLLGDPAMGGAAVYQTDAELGRVGFKAIPSAGIGAITGNADTLPSNYEVIGAGEKQGQVIAVPKGLSYSTATLNGSVEVRSLNESDGVKKANVGAFKTYARQLPNKSSNNLRGTSFATGMGQSGILQDPYMMSAVATTSVYGNTVGNTVSRSAEVPSTNPPINPKETAAEAAEAAKVGGLQAAGVVAGAATGAAQISGASKIVKGEKPNLAEVGALSMLPGGSVIAGAAFLGGGGKNKHQKGRDSIRKLGTQSGLFNKEDWTVTLSDGSTADIGTDGGGGKHEFRAPEGVVDEVRSLSAYDVDYTNDLDFTSNMMTNSLMRMIAGGKGTPIDQVAGQLGNAALGKVGFGQDMTEENFNYVRDNVRGFYFKQGIQTKEDAYALSNQMFSEGRITEMDHIAMQQGINMTFDDNGFDTANVIMSGRWKGLETAANIPSAPGPNYDAKPVSRIIPGDEFVKEQTVVEDHELEMNPGTYGGNSNTDVFTRSIITYKDPWSKRNGNESR